jgi:septal ring factor EnvC (AmiA/AmiB activator)
MQASMELTRLREDLKLTTGRLNTATGQAADLLQQLKSVQAENASLMSQLALSQGRDTEAAAAHAALQQSLEGMRADLQRCVLT